MSQPKSVSKCPVVQSLVKSGGLVPIRFRPVNILILLSVLLITASALSAPASARSKKAVTPAPPPAKSSPPTEDEIPASLDYDRRHAVDHRLELSPYIGDYFGDKLNHTFITGADLTFNFTNMFGIGGPYERLGGDFPRQERVDL